MEFTGVFINLSSTKRRVITKVAGLGYTSKTHTFTGNLNILNYQHGQNTMERRSYLLTDFHRCITQCHNGTILKPILLYQLLRKHKSSLSTTFKIHMIPV